MVNQEPDVIVLVHVHTGEIRSAVVIWASDKWKLEVHLGSLTGAYWFDIKKDRLTYTQHSRRLIPWRAQNLEHVEHVWKKLTSGGVHQIPDDVIKKADLSKTEAFKQDYLRLASIK